MRSQGNYASRCFRHMHVIRGGRIHRDTSLDLEQSAGRRSRPRLSPRHGGRTRVGCDSLPDSYRGGHSRGDGDRCGTELEITGSCDGTRQLGACERKSGTHSVPICRARPLLHLDGRSLDELMALRSPFLSSIHSDGDRLVFTIGLAHGTARCRGNLQTLGALAEGTRDCPQGRPRNGRQGG